MNGLGKIIRVSPINMVNKALSTSMLERSCRNHRGWFSRCFTDQPSSSSSSSSIPHNETTFYYRFHLHDPNVTPMSSNQFKHNLKNWIHDMKKSYKEMYHYHKLHHNNHHQLHHHPHSHQTVSNVWQSFFNSLGESNSPATSTSSSNYGNVISPAFTLTDHTTHYTVQIDVPGVKKSDISLTFSKEGTIVLETNNTVTSPDINSLSNDETTNNNNNNNLEKSFVDSASSTSKTSTATSTNSGRRYHKEINFDEAINCEKITARLEDGILYITVPKEVNTNINIQ